jgi:RNA polymerase sigma-70 factor (ECF subfamily)
MDVAEEIVQEVFIKLWERREELEFNSSVKSYLFRAVHNTSLNYLRHLKVREEHRQYAEERHQLLSMEYSDGLEEKELENRIWDAIGRLPEQCARIFQMSRFEGLKYREIADKLGISPKTVEVQMGKALRRLREDLKDYLPTLLGGLSTFFSWWRWW